VHESAINAVDGSCTGTSHDSQEPRVPPNRKPQAEFAKLLSGAHPNLVLKRAFPSARRDYLSRGLIGSAARAAGFVLLKRNAGKIWHWYLLTSLGCDGGHRLRSMGLQETKSLARFTRLAEQT